MATNAITVNAGRCTWETIDDETMVIDTTTGELFVLRGIAASVWDSLTGGQATVEGLGAEALLRHGVEAQATLGTVLDELTSAEVLVAASLEHEAQPQWPAQYQEPSLERFVDIADILTLDPIHEVDPGAGWPTQPTDPSR